MSQADALLKSLSEEDVSTFTARPEEEGNIVIDKHRHITVPESLKRIAVQYDHNIETVTFECPRYWDHHDLSKMQIYINYMRPNKTTGSYIATMVEGYDDMVVFSWTISNHVTQYKGPLAFLVCAKQTDEDGLETLHWNTELNTDMYISEGLECEDTVISQNPSIITDLLTRMDMVEEISVNAITAYNECFETVYSENRLSDTYAGKMDSQGVVTSDVSYVYTNFIPVTEGEIIQCSGRTDPAYGGDPLNNGHSRGLPFFNVAAFDSNKEICLGAGTDSFSWDYTVPIGVSYIVCSIPSGYVDIFIGTKVPLYDNDTPYTPYHEPILALKPSAMPKVIGDFDAALDELHAYAQALISGGDA